MHQPVCTPAAPHPRAAGREIDELTGIIKHDIQALNDGIAQLQQLSARRPDGNKQSAEHSHTVVDSLRTRLKDATAEFKEVCACVCVGGAGGRAGGRSEWFGGQRRLRRRGMRARPGAPLSRRGGGSGSSCCSAATASC